MPKISEERLERIRALFERDAWEFKDEKIKAFLQRALEESPGIFFGYDVRPNQSLFQAPHSRELEGVDIVYVGVPVDVGAPFRSGTRLGPRAIRQWSHIHGPVHHVTRTIPYEICNICDYGDVEFSDSSNLEVVVKDIYETYLKFKSADVVPLSLGGEHTITYPILKTLGQDEPLGLIHLDAHADTGGKYRGTTLNDGNLFRYAAADGIIDPERTIQIGMRGRATILYDFSYDSGMRLVTAEEFQERGVKSLVEEARKIVGEGPCYLTIDSDVFDCTHMPGTTLPEAFGLTPREVRDFLRGLRGLDLVGADLVEICPAYDPTGASANLAAGICFEMLCLLAEARVTRTGRKRKTHWKK